VRCPQQSFGGFTFNMKLIPLSQTRKCKRGELKLFAQVDDADYEEINKYKWTLKNGNKTFYAGRTQHLSNGKTKSFQMHRQILGLTDPTILCDHKDQNGLNNQRENLRQCNKSQNAHNTKARGASKYIGVGKYIDKRHKTHSEIWTSYIRINGKNTYIGRFKTEREAAIAYNDMANKHPNEFRSLNIIE